jgi:DNA-binding GntR family transcriptional regulator
VNKKSSDQAYQTIKDKILSSDIHPGFQLKEVHLAKEMNLTRTPIRKALSRLEKEGLVLIIPNKGAFIRELSPEDIDDIFEVREALELKAAHLAIWRASRDDLNRLTKGLDRREAKLRQREFKYYIPEFDFHEELIKLGKNKILYSMWNSLHNQLQLVRFLKIRSTDIFDKLIASVAEHRKILFTIYENEPEKLSKLIIAHVKSAKDDLFSCMQNIDNNLD